MSVFTSVFHVIVAVEVPTEEVAIPEITGNTTSGILTGGGNGAPTINTWKAPFVDSKYKLLSEKSTRILDNRSTLSFLISYLPGTKPATKYCAVLE